MSKYSGGVREGYLVGVKDGGEWFQFDIADEPGGKGGTGFIMRKSDVREAMQDFVPEVGDFIRLFNYQGTRVRGVSVNRVELYYWDDRELDRRHREDEVRRERELHEEFDRAKERLDAEYESYPNVFKQRIDKFRNTNPDFRWRFERYEMSCCTDALGIAEAYWQQQKAIDHQQVFEGTEGDPPDWFKRFSKLSFDDQKMIVKLCADHELFDGHSGNSFGFAMRLAFHYVVEPENVWREHGALTPLVGCIEYGCPHPYEPEAS